MGDKYYDKRKTGEKESYWNAGMGKAAILGGWRSGHSMDVTHPSPGDSDSLELSEVNWLYDDNSPILASRLISTETLSHMQLPPDLSLWMSQDASSHQVWSHLLNPTSANTHRSFLVFPISVDGITFTDVLHKIL